MTARKSSIDYKENIMIMMDLVRTVPIIFFDIETTGLNRQFDRIISFSAVKCIVRDGKLMETGRFNQFINPGFSIPASASAVSHITDETVKDAPHEKDAFRNIHNFLGDEPLLCGYNSVSFDEKFVNSMYLRQSGKPFTPVHHTDVMKMAKEQLQLKKYNLSEVAHEMGCDRGIFFHTSIDDVIATRRVFVLLLPYYIDGNSERTGNLRADVCGVKYWEPGHKLARLYVQTRPFSKTYYDLYKGEWRSDLAGVDMNSLVRDVLKYTGARNERELSRKARTYL